ncbi:MAG: hypothetical protein ABI210_03570 [Abditibacteriaceae bacterium]
MHNPRKAQNNLPCRKHPALCVSLFAFMFTPAIAAVISLGRLLTQLIPHPSFLAIMSLAPAFIILLIIGMLIGTFVWLLLMKHFVSEDILAAFFLVDPPVPIFSKICSMMFDWAYDKRRTKNKM